MKILLGLACCFVATTSALNGQTASTWVGSWAASQQAPEPENSLAPDDLRDATLRQLVHLSVGGRVIRIHVSNVFGTEPLHLQSVHLGQPINNSSAAIDPATDKAVTFHGTGELIVPAGTELISDSVVYSIAPLSNLAISIHFEDPPTRQTGHPGSHATSYLVHGNFVSASDLPHAKKFDHWYQLAGIDVMAPSNAASIVVLGDSITDGHGATTNGNDRWTDVLARRLQHAPGLRNVGVLNQGIGGNHLLTDGLGPNALARFDRDVLAQTGVQYLIVLEGVNDLGGLTRANEVSAAEHAALVQRICSAYEQIIARAHTHGITAIGATILPYMGSDYYHPGPANESDRQAVNQWIRTPGHFDAVIDFDQVMRDPAHPDHLRPDFDCGDHLHPSPAGYAAMAEAVPLSLFSGSHAVRAQSPSLRTAGICMCHKDPARNDGTWLLLCIDHFSCDQHTISQLRFRDHEVFRRIRYRAVRQSDGQVHDACAVSVHGISSRKGDADNLPGPVRPGLINDGRALEVSRAV
jgi:lysophospholipase L1-like esterase